MIVVICDATRDIGYGHLKRCLSLAFFYRQLGMTVVFLMQKLSPVVKDILDAQGMEAMVTPNQSEAISYLLSLRDQIDLLIIDHYEVGVGLEEKLVESFPILVIDDLLRPHWCHLLVDQTMNRVPHDYKEKLNNPCAQALTGIDYTLIDPFYNGVKSFKDTHHILITFGATDPGKAVLTVLDILERKINHKDLAFHVPLSSLSPCVEELEMRIQESKMDIRLYLDLPDLKFVYEKCGIAIGAPGTSLLERIYCGLNNITIVVAENQRAVGRMLDREGAALCLGDIRNLDAGALVDQLRLLIDAPAYGRKLQERARGLVDGKGAVRVVKETVDLISSVSLPRAEQSDRDVLYRWQHQEGARKYFRVPTPPTKDEHQAWFDHALSSDDVALFIVVWCDTPIGYVRLNNRGGKKEISILIARNFQGFGFAKKALLKVILTGTQPYCAVIHPENKASIGLFTSLGFECAGKGEYIFNGTE